MLILQDNTTNRIIGVYDDDEPCLITVTMDEGMIYDENGDTLPEMEIEYR